MTYLLTNGREKGETYMNWTFISILPFKSEEKFLRLIFFKQIWILKFLFLFLKRSRREGKKYYIINDIYMINIDKYSWLIYWLIEEGGWKKGIRIVFFFKQIRILNFCFYFLNESNERGRRNTMINILGYFYFLKEDLLIRSGWSID